MRWSCPRRSEQTSVENTPAPEHAWHALAITNDWVRHADTKAGVTMAFVGATAAALSSLVTKHELWTSALTVATWVAIVAMIGASWSVGLALVPRVKLKKQKKGRTAVTGPVTTDDAVNLLFFGDVHRRYGDDRPSYREVLALLTSDPTRLTGMVADQIHANARIATVKFRWANLAVVCELGAALAVGAVALLIGTGW